MTEEGWKKDGKTERRRDGETEMTEMTERRTGP